VLEEGGKAVGQENSNSSGAAEANIRVEKHEGKKDYRKTLGRVKSLVTKSLEELRNTMKQQGLCTGNY